MTTTALEHAPEKEKDAIRDDLTLAIERVIPAPRAAVWRCWTEPALLQEWFCPRPWRVTKADLEIRAGGRMNVDMAGPDGESVAMTGAFVEVVPGSRLVFTDSFEEGFRPRASPFMAGFVALTDAEGGATRMVWGARHATAEAMEKHLAMGFETGWNAAADQLAALATSLPAHKAAPEDFRAKVRTCLFLPRGAEDAATFYVATVPGSEIDAIYRPDPNGPAMVVEFALAGTPMMAMNGNPDPVSSHLSSISILTEDQAETDRLWHTLIAGGGEAGRCGWLKDRFGVHWQIVPKALPRLMTSGDQASSSRVHTALMEMTKIDIAALEAAFAAKEH